LGDGVLTDDAGLLLGILVTLTPSLLAVAWLIWRADVPEVKEEEFSNSRRLQSDLGQGETTVRRPKGRQRRRLEWNWDALHASKRWLMSRAQLLN